MKAENYRQLLNNDRNSHEMTSEEFDNTLMHFAKLYHQEQQCNVAGVSNNEVPLKAFVVEFIEAWEDGNGGDSDLYRKAKSLA